MKLDNWFIVNNRAYGNVSGSHRFEEGEFIATSPIVKREDRSKTSNMIITTKSGSVYELGPTYVNYESGEEIE
jgi:hypothetical protein